MPERQDEMWWWRAVSHLRQERRAVCICRWETWRQWYRDWARSTRRAQVVHITLRSANGSHTKYHSNITYSRSKNYTGWQLQHHPTGSIGWTVQDSSDRGTTGLGCEPQAHQLGITRYREGQWCTIRSLRVEEPRKRHLSACIFRTLPQSLAVSASNYGHRLFWLLYTTSISSNQRCLVCWHRGKLSSCTQCTWCSHASDNIATSMFKLFQHDLRVEVDKPKQRTTSEDRFQGKLSANICHSALLNILFAFQMGVCISVTIMCEVMLTSIRRPNFYQELR